MHSKKAGTSTYLHGPATVASWWSRRRRPRAAAALFRRQTPEDPAEATHPAAPLMPPTALGGACRGPDSSPGRIRGGAPVFDNSDQLAVPRVPGLETRSPGAKLKHSHAGRSSSVALLHQWGHALRVFGNRDPIRSKRHGSHGEEAGRLLQNIDFVYFYSVRRPPFTQPALTVEGSFG